MNKTTTKETAMNRITQLNNEAVKLGMFLLAGDFNLAQGIAATERIESICREIGGSPRELISNCEQIVAGRRVNPLTEAGN
jgi:hypothetical protein